MAAVVVDMEKEGPITTEEKFTKWKALYLFGMCLILVAIWVLRGNVSADFQEKDVVEYRFQTLPESNEDFCPSCPPWLEDSLSLLVSGNTTSIGTAKYSPRRGILQLRVTVLTNLTIPEHILIGPKPRIFVDADLPPKDGNLYVSCFEDNFEAGELNLCEDISAQVFKGFENLQDVEEMLTLQAVLKVDNSRNVLMDWKIIAMMQFDRIE